MSAFTQAIDERWNPAEWSIAVSGEELGFSWHPCDCCGSRLGGDRHGLIAINNDKPSDTIIVPACVDCLMYIANGDEPENWED